LVARLEKSDPHAAGRIDKSNRRRLLRAIEIAAGGRAHAAAHQRAPRYDCLQRAMNSFKRKFLNLTWPIIANSRRGTISTHRVARVLQA
jgi:tRNA A37 N6-isopentenylltransferase MiaA